MHLLSYSRRPHRAGDWTQAGAVTFIVTLAATQSVTHAARRARMSRKSAYALKARDPAFAAAWIAAIAAGALARRQGDKVKEVHEPRIRRGRGNKPVRWRTLTKDLFARDSDFAELARRRRDSGPLAAAADAQ